MSKIEQNNPPLRKNPFVVPMGLQVSANPKDRLVLVEFFDANLENRSLFSCALPRTIAENLFNGLRKALDDQDLEGKNG